jgi:glycosyltransferase involved in cell wall biosynthesis
MTSSLIQKPFGISVVIPTFNRPQVRRAVESVASATPERVEVLVVDDGSDVDVRDLLPRQNSYGVGIRIYRLTRNKGPQAARNLGIRRAGFQYVAFLDSDDEFQGDKVDKVLARLAEGDIDVLFHAAEGLRKYNFLARLWATHLRRFVSFYWWLSAFNPVGTPTLVVRRSIRLGLPRLRHCEDYCFLLRYCEPQTRVVYVDEILAAVHRSPGTAGGLSGALWRMRKSEFVARRVLLRKITAADLLRFLLGTTMGSLRVCTDVARLRYWR